MTTFIVCSTVLSIAIAFILKDYKLKSEMIESKAYIEANRTRHKLAMDANLIKEENSRIKVDLHHDESILVRHIKNYCNSINTQPKTLLAIKPLVDSRHKVYNVKFCHTIDDKELTTTLKVTVNFGKILDTEVLEEEQFDRVLLITGLSSDMKQDIKLITGEVSSEVSSESNLSSSEQYVYCIGPVQDDSRNKIGKSNNPETRLGQLQTGSSQLLVIKHKVKVQNMTEVESKLHKTFEDSRVMNEWFEVSSWRIYQEMKKYEV